MLSAGIIALGGQWRNDLTRDVTHLFAESSASERYRTGINHRDLKHCIKVLVPDWFDDAVRLSTRDFNTDTYEWPDVGGLSVRHLSQPEPPKSDSKDAWSGRRILLSTNLALAGSRRKVVEGWIRESKGLPMKYTNLDATSEDELSLLDDCDVFITRYRSGPAFFKVRDTPISVACLTLLQAWRSSKIIGTLTWLLKV